MWPAQGTSVQYLSSYHEELLATHDECRVIAMRRLMQREPPPTPPARPGHSAQRADDTWSSCIEWQDSDNRRHPSEDAGFNHVFVVFQAKSSEAATVALYQVGARTCSQR